MLIGSRSRTSGVPKPGADRVAESAVVARIDVGEVAVGLEHERVSRHHEWQPRRLFAGRAMGSSLARSSVSRFLRPRSGSLFREEFSQRAGELALLARIDELGKRVALVVI